MVITMFLLQIVKLESIGLLDDLRKLMWLNTSMGMFLMALVVL